MATQNIFDQFDNAFDVFDADYKGPVHRPMPEPSLLQEAGGKLKSGLIAGTDWLSHALGDLAPDMPGSPYALPSEMERDPQGARNRETAQIMAQDQRDFENADVTSTATQEGLQAISDADGMWDATKAAVTHPRAVAMTGAQSLGMVAPGMVAGMASGPAAPLVVGGNSAAIEYQSTLRDVMTNAGVDLTDAAQVRAALDNPELMAQAKDKAAKRGVAIGAFDALTAGLAGRLLAASKGVTSAAARTGGEVGVQLGGGMAGEASGQALTGEYKPGDIVMEGIAEVPTTITEVPTNYRRAREAFRERQSDEQFVQGDYSDLAGQFGATITSRKRTPKHNAEVGGVPGSQHLSGTAGDFVVPEERKSAFKAEARARGYEAIDEGDHIHLELPKQRETFARRKMEGPQTPASRTVDTALSRAREARGIKVEDEPTTRVAPPTPTRSVDELISRANDPNLSPAERREAKRLAQRGAPTRVAGPIEELRDKLLDQVTQQARALEQPQPQPEPQLPAPPPTATVEPAPPAPVPSEPQAFEQFEPTTTPADLVAPPAQTPASAPAPAPMPQPEAPQAQTLPPAAPASPQPPSAVAPVPQAPQEPAAPVAPPARTLEPYGPWTPVGTDQTPETRLLSQALRRDPNLGRALGLTAQDNGEVYHVQLEPTQQSRLDQLASVLGRKIVLFGLDSPNKAMLGGVAFDAKHIFVNYEGLKVQGKPILGVVGHEFTHTLRTQGSQLLENLIGFAKSRVNVKSSYVAKRFAQYQQLYAARGMNDAEVADAFAEELVADFIGDLVNDEQFWNELAQADLGLFKRTINALIRFLTKMTEKARRLGADDAFEDISAMREQAMAILREHIADPDHVKVEGKNRRGKVKASLGERRDLVKQRGEQIAHSYFERGQYMDAAQQAARISDEHAPPIDIKTPEQKEFFKDASPEVKQGDKAAVFFHGKVSGKSTPTFRTNAGSAVFLAEKASFSGPYAAAGFAKQQKMGRIDVIVDGQSMVELMSEHKKGTPDYIFADVMQQAEGDVNKALDLLEDYQYADMYGDPVAVDDETHDQVIDRLQGVAFLQDSEPNIVQVKQRADYTGMHLMPLVTNVKNPWDYTNKHHVKKLVDALRDKFGSLAEFRKSLHMGHQFEDWDQVARSLSNAGSNWTLVEDLGADIPGLIREMGFDAYHVSEEGHKNLAVFDPKQLKAAYGNVGSFGVRKPTAEEAAALGMTLEEAIAAQAEGHIQLSLGSAFYSSFTNGLWKPDSRAQLERWFADEFRDLRDIQKTIANNGFGGVLPQGLDAHKYENLRHGAFKDARDRAEERFIRPIAKLLSRVNGASKEGFSDYLWWRHAGERDAYLRRNLDPALAATIPADGLAGIDPAEAQRNIAALDPRVRQTYERAAKFVDAMRKFTLDTLLHSGQITQTHYTNLLNQYRHYVPLRGRADIGDEVANGSARGLSMAKNPTGKRATGRSSEPLNLLEEMMKDMEGALVNAQKQKVLDALVKLIAANPDPDLWEVQPVTAERKWVNGVLTVVQANGEPADQITFMHRGIPVKIEIRHPELKKALLNINQPMPDILRNLGRVTRFLSAVKTSFSPYFLLINPVRDAGFATLAVLSEHDMATLADVAKFYPYTYGAIKNDDANRPQAPSNSPVARKMQQYVREFSSSGGKTGYTYVADIRENQRKLKHMLDRHAKSPGMAEVLKGGVLGKDGRLLMRKGFQHVSHTFEVVNDMAENSTRLAVYAAMREKGMSVEDAAAYAKEVTVNFNRRGSLGKVLGGFYMFFNAAMQGGVRMGKLMKNKKFLGAMGSIMVGSYAMALGQMMAAGDDDDGESNYDKAISDSQAQRSIGVYLGDGKSLALPVPYGPNIFSYLGYRVAKLHYDTIRGRDPSVGKAAGDIVGQALMSMSPVDPGKGWAAFLPEFARVPAQAATNQNDFGGKLNYRIMGTADEKALPKFHLTDERVGLPYRWMAMAVNTASGGSKYEPGAVDMSGEQARYVLEQAGGGLLRMATETWGLVENSLAGIDPEPSDIPLANVYFRGKGERRHGASYYDNKTEFDTMVSRWKLAVESEDEAAMDKLLEKAPWIDGAETDAGSMEGQAAQAGTPMEANRDVEREIRKLRDEQRAVQADKNLDWKERKRLSREIDLEIADLQKDFNFALNQARGVRSTQGSR